MHTKDYIESIESVLTSLAILIGGGWTFWRFVLQREVHPKIQFDIDVNFITVHDKRILFEVVLIIENKGLVRHEIDADNFTLRIRYMTKTDKIEEGDSSYNHQTNFPHLHDITNTQHRKVIPESWKNTFVDPGISQKYSYITSLPEETISFIVKSKFNYSERKSDFHGVQKLFAVPQLKES